LSPEGKGRAKADNRAVVEGDGTTTGMPREAEDGPELGALRSISMQSFIELFARKFEFVCQARIPRFLSQAASLPCQPWLKWIAMSLYNAGVLMISRLESR
jgi:hypothetical protein